MKLAEWLSYIESFEEGLTNRSLAPLMLIASKLGVISFPCKIIVVGGTNGKGSTVCLLENILLASNLKVCSYLSPHLLRFNERIRLNGKEVNEDTLCQAFYLVEKTREKTDLSWFGFVTLSALTIFKNYNPDILILEIGLGGKFDPVNLLDNDIAIITTVSFDHLKILGSTLEAIGGEKAGIMRPLKPIICGNNMPKSIYSNANRLQSILYCLGNEFSYKITHENSWSWTDGRNTINNLPLPKIHLNNASLALMAIKVLSKYFNISLLSIKIGLTKTFLPGRFQQLKYNNKKIILDVAHNIESMKFLASNLLKQKITGRTLAIVGILKDKEITCLNPLLKIVDKWYLGKVFSIRGLSPFHLFDFLQQNEDTSVIIKTTINEAFKQAIKESTEKDRIVVCGSFYSVSEVLSQYKYYLHQIDTNI